MATLQERYDSGTIATQSGVADMVLLETQKITQWAADVVYKQNQVVYATTGSGGHNFMSLVNNNVGNPVTDTTKWQDLGVGGLNQTNVGKAMRFKDLAEQVVAKNAALTAVTNGGNADTYHTHTLDAISEKNDIMLKSVYATNTAGNMVDKAATVNVPSTAASGDAYVVGTDGTASFEPRIFVPDGSVSNQVLANESGQITWMNISDISGGFSEVTFTLTAAGWSNATPPTQTVSVANNNTGVIGLNNNATSAQYDAASNAGLQPIARTDGSITFAANGVKPTVDVPCVYREGITTESFSVYDGLDSTSTTAALSANQGYVLANRIAAVRPGLPVGAVFPFAGQTAPAHCLVCDGSAVSRATYAALYAVLGDLYGAGDGSTTFNLPDLRGRFVEGVPTGVAVGTYVAAGLPDIEGTTPSALFGSASAKTSGAITTTIPNEGRGTGTGGGGFGSLSFAASASNSIYGNSTTVQPPALTMLFVIVAE